EHDALGRRIVKRYRGQTTHFVWDGPRVLHEWVEGALSPALIAAPPMAAAVCDVRASSAARASAEPAGEGGAGHAASPPAPTPAPGARALPLDAPSRAKSLLPAKPTPLAKTTPSKPKPPAPPTLPTIDLRSRLPPKNVVRTLRASSHAYARALEARLAAGG